LRKVFWNHKLWERTISADGDLKAVIIRDVEVSELIEIRDTNTGQTVSIQHCVKSQEVLFLDRNNGFEVVRAHQYITDEGEIGASGAPDPKRIKIGMDYYRIADEIPCEMCVSVGPP